METGAGMILLHDSKKSLLTLILGISLVFFLIVLIGYLAVDSQQQAAEEQIYSELETIAELKAGTISPPLKPAPSVIAVSSIFTIQPHGSAVPRRMALSIRAPPAPLYVFPNIMIKAVTAQPTTITLIYGLRNFFCMI